MKIRLGDLRRILSKTTTRATMRVPAQRALCDVNEAYLQVYFQHLDEAVDIGKIASRGIKNRGILVHTAHRYETLIAVSLTETAGEEDLVYPRIFGACVAINQDDGSWKVATLYADDPTTAIFLLGAALSRWQTVVADESVSPAAQAVMKRYFDSNKDDPSKIKMATDDERPEDPDYFKATYLGPLPGFDLERAIANGVTAAENCGHSVDEVTALAAHVAEQGDRGFRQAYNDKKRTGLPYGNIEHDFEDGLDLDVLLERGLTQELIGYLMEVVNGGSNVMSNLDALQFIERSHDALVELSNSAPDENDRRQWHAILDWYEANKQ